MRFTIRLLREGFGLALFVALGMAFFAPTPVQAQSSAVPAGGTVREVVISGNQRIEAETVRSYLLLQEGDAFDRDRIDRSLKALFATGLFADVNLKRVGDRLEITVVENPVINRVAFEGNKRLSDDQLLPEIGLKPRTIYTRTKVQNDVQRLLAIYRRHGRFAATVEPKIIKLEQNRVDLVFEVEEGAMTEVKSIRFIGNKGFSDGRLREVVRTKETRWYRFFSSDDNYDPDRLTFDRELLRRFYLRKGYADFRVVSAVAELTPDRAGFFLTFTVEEGDRYKFGKIETVINLRDLKEDDYIDTIEIAPGDWFDSEAVDATADKISNKVSLLGFPFVDVKPRVDRDRDKREINLAYEISEGPRVFVERIDIQGNVRTQDNVIRREFRMVEGDAFNAAKLRRSEKRLKDLEFFEKVNVEQIPGATPDKTVVNVEVTEKSTGSLSLGAGYSTVVGPLADIGLRERNLLGKGQELGVSAQISAKRTSYDLSFTEPYFMDREVAAGFDLFHVKRDLQNIASYNSSITGGAVRAGYSLTENMSQRWKYTLKQTEVTHVKPTASSYIKSEEGSRVVSEVQHSIAYDRRDSKSSPTDGYILRLTTDLAGLGGDDRYFRNKLTGVKYFPIAEQWVLSLTGNAGHILGLGQDVRLNNRYFIGGDDLRGFMTGGVGPRDKTTRDALGGEWMYTGSAELQFPLGLPSELRINGKLFVDAGSSGGISQADTNNIYDTKSMRVSTGTGIAWVSPMGPIGVDFGIPLMKEAFDKTELFRVNFGTRF